MASSNSIYQQDLVQLISDPNLYGIVVRCWHDAEDIPLVPDNDPFLRPLKQGEVVVSFFNEDREILQESSLRLVDRCLQLGDYVKRKNTDLQSAVVSGLKVSGRLAHAITSSTIPGWFTVNDVKERCDAEIGDLVLYDDWVGQVIETYDEVVVELSTSSRQLVLMPELGTRMQPGDRGTDIIPQTTSYNPLGFLLGNNTPEQTVLSVRHTIYAISWLAINQMLEPLELAHKQRPKRLWHGPDIEKLTLLPRSDEQLHIGSRVHLKDPTGVPVTEHGSKQDGHLALAVDTLVVKETRTELELLWQDGTREAVLSVNVVPYQNPDEYDCWPGDHVVLKQETTRRPGVVQSVNAVERIASVLFIETQTVEVVSLLDLDTQGSSEPFDSVPHTDGFGVCRGDVVLLHQDEASNGSDPPKVPIIGELEHWVRDTGHEGDTAEWRKELSKVGMKVVTGRTPPHSLQDHSMQSAYVPESSHRLAWIAEVTKINLDGTTHVTFPDKSSATYPLEKLSRLSEGLMDEDLLADDGSSEQSHLTYEWSMDEDHEHEHVQPEHELDFWEDSHPSSPVVSKKEASSSSATPKASHTPAMASPNHSPLSSHPTSPASEVVRNFADNTSSNITTEVSFNVPDTLNTSVNDCTWERFSILPNAPVDHAFYSVAPSPVSRPFLTRLSKEHRALSSSLPDTILVRAYEDRSDLLRSLIIGPPNTPYEDAPFVIDWFLDGQFPQTPPKAHFISWTDGNGRVNPNLYEDGKVCLSILGTWAGDKNESWNAARSSILQALVSIQGLVLVKEPYFCEPSYEKFRGTEEATVSSRLYNERAFIMSRGFVRKALEALPSGLEEDINWLYFDQGKLRKVISDCERLVANSQLESLNEERTGLRDELPAIPRLSGGGVISLKRTLTRLSEILQSHTS